MKKFFPGLFLFVFFCEMPLAMAVVPAPISLEKLATRTIRGIVEYINYGNPAKKIMSTIVIIQEDGKRISMEIQADTVFYDKNGQTIAWDKLKRGDEVVIEYVVKREIIEKAESIKLIK